MSYRDLLTGLGDATAATVLAIHASYLEDDLDAEEAAALMAAVIAAANARAVGLADSSLAATLTLALREPVPTLGLGIPPDTRDRLAKGATTLLGADDAAARVERFGRSEPLEAAARASSEAIAGQPVVTGWTRGVSPGACQLCEWWARDGQVWPDTHPMPDHKGCTCVQIPVTKEEA